MSAQLVRLVVALSLAAASLVVFIRPATAQTLRDLPGSDPHTSAFEGLQGKSPYWSAGKPRWFFASATDAGVIYGRTEADIGYGKPFYSWGGIDAWTKLSPAGVSFYGGARLSIPHFQLRGGLRHYTSTNQHLLNPRQTYERIQLDLDDTPRTHYGSLEAETTVDAPLGPGQVSFTATLYGLFGVQKGFYLLEDALRVIVDPPWIFRTRVAYLANVGKWEDLSLGGAVELLNVPNRAATYVRIGPLVTVSLTHHLQATGAASITVAGRDKIGLAGSDLGQIGLRYRWTTGDLWPEFP